jgi:hypothetical protein
MDFSALGDQILGGEIKALPTSAMCICGSEAVLVNTDLGYSCLDPKCNYHMKGVSVCRSSASSTLISSLS